MLTELRNVVNITTLSMTDKERMDGVERLSLIHISGGIGRLQPLVPVPAPLRSHHGHADCPLLQGHCRIMAVTGRE